MAINFACPHCGKRFTAKDEHAGKRGKCSACGGVTTVPSQPTRVADDSPTPSAASRASAPAEKQERRPLWKNPFVVIGMAASNLILAACLTSLAWLHFRANRSGADAQGLVDRSINPVGPKQPLRTNQKVPPPIEIKPPPRVPPVNAAAAKSRIDPASSINKPPARVPPITPPPIEKSLVGRSVEETRKLMNEYRPEMISSDLKNLDPRTAPWPISVPMQGRIPNFPVGTEAIVHVGDDQFNKDPRLSESGAVGNGSIVLRIAYDMSFHYGNPNSIYPEASRLYARSIMAGDPVGINMVIASGYAVRVKTGTRVRVVVFDGGRGELPLPCDGRSFRDVKILAGERSGVTVSIPALYLEPAP